MAASKFAEEGWLASRPCSPQRIALAVLRVNEMARNADRLVADVVLLSGGKLLQLRNKVFVLSDEGRRLAHSLLIVNAFCFFQPRLPGTQTCISRPQGQG